MSDLVFLQDGRVVLPPPQGDPAAAASIVHGWDRHVVGVDLGRQDPTALVVLRDRCLPEWTGRGFEQRLGKRQRVAVFHETVQLEDYNDVAAYVIRRLEQIPNWDLIVDASGLGMPFSHVLAQAGVKHWAAVITAGNSVSKVGTQVSVSKNTLVENLATGLETGELQIAADIQGRDQLLTEIASFRLEMTSAGNTVLAGGGKGHHADAAIALALAWLKTTHLQDHVFRALPLTGSYG